MLAAGAMPAACATVGAASTAQVVSMQGSGKVLAEYIWLGSTGADLRSRTVVLDELPASGSPDELPIAEIEDATACGGGHGQQLFLQPRKVFPDPFRGGPHVLVLCDTYVPPQAADPAVELWQQLAPHVANHRPACAAVMAAAAPAAPLFSLQQEYSLAAVPAAGFCDESGSGEHVSGGFVFASPSWGHQQQQQQQQQQQCHHRPGAMPIKQHYQHQHHHQQNFFQQQQQQQLSDKAAARLGHDVAELHARACRGAGLAYSSGGGAAPAPAPGYALGAAGDGAWSYGIGPLPCGVDAADQLSVSRHLLRRAAERVSAEVSFGWRDDDGSSGRPLYHHHHHHHHGLKCGVQFSTAASRDPSGGAGLAEVQRMLDRLHTSSAAAALLGGGANGSAAFDQSSWHTCSGFSEDRHPCGGAINTNTNNNTIISSDTSSPCTDAGGSSQHSSGSGACDPLAAGRRRCFTIGAGPSARASVLAPTSTLVRGAGPIVDRRPPADADPYLSAMLLAAGALGLPLPPATASAMQLAAAALATATATATGAGAAAAALPLPIAGQGHRQHTHHHHHGGAGAKYAPHHHGTPASSSSGRHTGSALRLAAGSGGGGSPLSVGAVSAATSGGAACLGRSAPASPPSGGSMLRSASLGSGDASGSGSEGCDSAGLLLSALDRMDRRCRRAAAAQQQALGPAAGPRRDGGDATPTSPLTLLAGRSAGGGSGSADIDVDLDDDDLRSDAGSPPGRDDALLAAALASDDDDDLDDLLLLDDAMYD